MRFARSALAALALLGCSGSQSLDPAEPSVPSNLAKPKPRGSAIVVTSLPLLAGGQSGVAFAINDAEEIVGQSQSTAGFMPVRWTRGTGGAWQVASLGSSPGYARDINEAGTAVGRAGSNAVLWPRSGPPEILGPGEAMAINGSDVVIGVRNDVTPHRAVAWTRASPSGWVAHDLAPLPGELIPDWPDSWPEGISEDGVAVGLSNTRLVRQQAIYWTPNGSGGWNSATVIPGAASAGITEAAAIVGTDVVGRRSECATCQGRAWHWSLSGQPAIGSLGSHPGAYADGINAGRTIVGYFVATKGANQVTNAFVWSPADPVMTSMGKGWAHDVNNPTASRSARQAVGENANKPILWTIP